MLLNGLKKGAGIAALAVLAACASTPDESETIVPAAPVVEAPQGEVPGSMEDLKKNVGHRVFFGYNQYNLTNESQAILRRQAAWLQEYPGSRIRIEGNCDERGTREYNLALGARRANAAKAFLVGLGVDAGRIQVISNGKENPVDPRSTPEAWSINRNATTVLTTAVSS